MKKMLLLPLVIGIMMGCSDKKDVDLSAANTQAEVHVKLSTDPFMAINIETTSGDPEVQKLIDSSIEEYKNLVINIRQEFELHRAEVKQNFESNIAEFKKGIVDQEKEYKTSCTDINASNLAGCNTFGENLSNVKNQLGDLEARYQTQMKKVDADEKTQLAKFQAQMKNNINDLLSQANYCIDLPCDIGIFWTYHLSVLRWCILTMLSLSCGVFPPRMSLSCGRRILCN